MQRELIPFIVALTTLVGLYIYIDRLQDKLHASESELRVVNAQLALCNSNVEKCTSSSEKQNKHIRELELNEKLEIAKLKKWEQLPPKIKYKTIEKIREIQSNECKDTKDVLNAITDIKYNSL